MTQTVKIDGTDLDNYRQRLDSLNAKIENLAAERDEVEETVRVLERLLSSKEETVSVDEEPQPTVKRTFSGMKASLVYKKIVGNGLIDQPFRERDIRDYANENGLRVKRKPIRRDYSRTLLRSMLENDVIEKVDIGLYQKKIITTEAREGETVHPQTF